MKRDRASIAQHARACDVCILMIKRTRLQPLPSSAYASVRLRRSSAGAYSRANGSALQCARRLTGCPWCSSPASRRTPITCLAAQRRLLDRIPAVPPRNGDHDYGQARCLTRHYSLRSPRGAHRGVHDWLAHGASGRLGPALAAALKCRGRWTSNITAHLEDGVLTLTLNKRPESKPRRIAIQ